MTAERHALASGGRGGVVELATVERSGFVESAHFGAAVVVGQDGSILRRLGDASADVFGRSSLKLFQAIAVLRAGVELAGERLVLAAASHSGTGRHVRVVRDILDSGSLDEGLLQCPPAWPSDHDAAFQARSDGSSRRPIMMNCSGKHASFLLACAANGWPVDDYLSPMHPMQQRVRATIEEFTGEAVGATGVDGCGAPVFATTLSALAVGVGGLARGRDTQSRALTAAILADPWAIDGQGRANTVVIERLGLIAKGGAEGVMVMGTLDGTAVAVKVIDGSPRATTAIAVELLVSVGAVDPLAAREAIVQVTPRVLGGAAVVGGIRPSF